MNKILILICVLIQFLSLASCRQEQIKLLIGGSGWSKIAIIDKGTKKIEWEYPLEKGWECNSVACTDDGNILFSYSKGARLVSKDHNVIWDIKSPEGCEMQTADVLPNGNIILAWTGHPAVILETDKKGNIISRTEFETGIDNPHSQFRQISKNPDGNYVIPIMGGDLIYEVSPKGIVLNKITPCSNYFTVLNEGKENVYWVACGDKHILMKVDFSTGKVLEKIEQESIEGVRLFFVAGLCKSENDGLYVCNWQGHDKDAMKSNSPQLFEIDNSLNVVWSLNDNTNFGMISDVCIMK